MKNLPQKLNKGDTIGVISPAGVVKESSQIDAAVKYFENKGYKVKLAPHAGDKKAYLAGEDGDRLSDLMEMFKDSEIKAIMCSRGGYGTFRLLENIDWEVIKNNPKIFVGYSDITALLNNFVEKSELVCFHGPLAVSDFGTEEIDPYTEKVFWEVFEGKADVPYSFENPVQYRSIVAGQAEGVLMGGNLSILCGLLGTPYFPDFEDKILLLEDIGEPVYKIDRLLTQLKLAGVFEKAVGVLFADFTSVGENSDITPVEFIKEFSKDLNIPVGYGFAASHDKTKATLPLGVKYRFNPADFKLGVIESFIS